MRGAGNLPMFSDLLSKIAGSEGFRLTVESLLRGERRVPVHGLAGSLKAFLIAVVKQEMGNTILVVTSDEDEALRLRDDLETLIGEQKVRYFPFPFGRTSMDDPTGSRIEVLDSLLSGEEPVVVATLKALVWPVMPPEILGPSTVTLKVGQDRDLIRLSQNLVERGFERLPMVEEAGQMSLRGGILDVFPYGRENPYRIEFWGDTIESIRQFDVFSQRSIREEGAVKIPPASEILFSNGMLEGYLKRIGEVEREYGISLSYLKEKVREKTFFPGMESYLPIFYGNTTLLDYLDGEAVVLLSERTALEESFRELEDHLASVLRKGQEKGPAPLPAEALVDLEMVLDKAGAFRCVEEVPFKETGLVEFGARETRRFEGDLRQLAQEISDLSSQNYDIYILCQNKVEAQRLEELLEPYIGPLTVGVNSLHGGFVLPDARVALFNDHEIISHYRKRFRHRRFKGGVSIPDLTALGKGDFVVHQDHGIGRYMGIERLNIDDKQRDCLVLSYRDGDKLYVPVEELDRVKKYTGAEGVAPVLSKLGGTSWERVKARTKKAIRRMARELLELYAERKAREGYAFSPDSEWQRQLEASFVHEDTPDQLSVVKEIKEDLEKPIVMDRLVCGDVGYGKTEVAIRAAFKAVNDNKQVAVLVPTTILAQQHYDTFRARLMNFPVRIEVLSRFQSKKRQQEIIRGLAEGRVDIVIGTHRLLSQDVNFKDLGLVIVDEEQKFGVRQKERLKQFRRLVDVLTLTATPIPRTLHMSLMGARDLSVINTPPKERFPIQTEIIPFDEERIAEAILREVDRSGQVYFVHNRVRSINSVALFLERLLPQVNFVVAHGQMPEHQLEKVMVDFLNRRYDCLVCTMIIESGLDIPNVNTIIINRADRFGLAQLYQLRGRVGRSNRQAYAYLLVPPVSGLTRTARKRLRALEEFSELGSGFKLAMKDLEIRGAGNILGPQQHGFIAAVGFDMYCRLLEEAMGELKGEEREELPEPEVHIEANAFVPEDYISEPLQKISLYERLADAKRLSDVQEIREELRDRYGPIPPQTVSLLEIVQIKLLARENRLASLSIDGGCLEMAFPTESRFSKEDLQAIVKRIPGEVGFSFDERLKVKVKLPGESEHERLMAAKKALLRMR